MKIYLLAGEASGDKLGAALIDGLHRLAPDIEFRGVAGPLMCAQGMTSLFPMEELAVMGIAEVLPRYMDLRRRLHETAQDVLDWQPDALITIDSPDFSLRLAKLVKAKSTIRTVHYVAPSVWAWRAGRARKMARSVDQVLALLPFEPPFMEAEGMRCDFVGHPIAAEPVATQAEITAFRNGAGLGDAPYILALPGSRRTEISRLAPIFGESLKQVLASNPDLRVVVPAAPGKGQLVSEAIANWPGTPHVLDGANLPADLAPIAKRAAFAGADVALAASGTVSLELAAARTPMVVAYDMSWLSWQIMSRLAKVDTVTLVNLVAESRTVPEFLGPACKPDAIAAGLADLLGANGHRTLQLEAMDLTMQRLGQGGEAPGLRAALAVLDGVEQAR